MPCYVTCAYYRDGKDLGELREEMEMLKAQGHRAFKAKIGGASLDEDMARLRVIRDVIGDEDELMLDVNGDTEVRDAHRVRGWLKKPCGAILVARTLLKFTPPLRGSHRGQVRWTKADVVGGWF